MYNFRGKIKIEKFYDLVLVNRDASMFLCGGTVDRNAAR
jgi:hypothetical protein